MYIIIKSKKLHKKYDVINTLGKVISFGDNRYSDFTKHNDNDRKINYLTRHQNEDWTDLNKAGTWSRFILWNKPTIRKSINDMKKLFNINIIYLD